MKHTHSALLLVCLAAFLLTGCGSGKAGSSENPYLCTKQTASAGNYVTYDYDANGNCTKESRVILHPEILPAGQKQHTVRTISRRKFSHTMNPAMFKLVCKTNTKTAI